MKTNLIYVLVSFSSLGKSLLLVDAELCLFYGNRLSSHEPASAGLADEFLAKLHPAKSLCSLKPTP